MVSRHGNLKNIPELLSSWLRWQNTGMQELNRYAFIALGSNLGNSRQIVLGVMDAIQKSGRQPLLRSSLWRSTPVDCPDGAADFINAVIGYEPPASESPGDLLQFLQATEIAWGRTREPVLNAPRRIDLDIIGFRSEVVNTADLVIPHPRACDRLFVLNPLQEIAPDLILPGMNQSISALAAGLPPAGIVKLA
jgi:2-amino-4-hydroxy-6-hydroxymethyldihydropteridine diphosphokinase